MMLGLFKLLVKANQYENTIGICIFWEMINDYKNTNVCRQTDDLNIIQLNFTNL